MKTNKLKFVLYVPVADIICELILDNQISFSYFKKRFYFLPSATQTLIKIYIRETHRDFLFSTLPDSIACAVGKSKVSSLEEVYFIIRALIEYQIIKHGILLLHGSSFIKNGKACVFIAPSGSGKSTIIKSIAKKNVLSDDVTVLKKIGKKFYIFTSPFDNNAYIGSHLRKTQLDKIFLIKQASFTRFTKEAYANRLIEILYNNLLFLWFGVHKGKNEKVFEQGKIKLLNMGLDLIAYSPIETLYFTKDLNFMSLL